ncbi:GtrA family protein [Succinatimonas hippei]|uniref:GtrA family protein n=1 Tax=Succinatimonas hippei TaxID=626938 RepID=UPI00255C3826|nr:GtrA family protein [Succinatimonas hippei]
MTDNNFLVKVSQGGKFYELVRFVIVGGAATVTDLAVSVVLFFAFPDMSENAITTCAFCVAFFVSYFGHRYFTFKQHGNIFKFLLLSCSMLVLRNIIVFVLVRIWMTGLVPIIVAMALVTVITYLVSKFMVFKQK